MAALALMNLITAVVVETATRQTTEDGLTTDKPPAIIVALVVQ